MKERDSASAQGVVALVQLVRHVAPGDELAVHSIGPAVIAAGQQRRAPLLRLADLRTAVPAHVVHCVNSAVRAPRHDDRRAEPVKHEVVAALRDFRGMSDRDPVCRQESIELCGVHRGGAVQLLRQAEPLPVGLHQTPQYF